MPPELIAQRPLPQRDASRLMVLDRASSRLHHQQFSNVLDYLQPGDVLVVNDSRVIPARLHGRKRSGGQVEILLLSQIDSVRWQALVGGKRMGEGAEIVVTAHDGTETEYVATVTAIFDGPRREVQFNQPIAEVLGEVGHTPLPPLHSRSIGG
ncbi:MAG: S-adenosylmethionine:tRNA ribosyltransferase-isomerase, partial [Anaerolineae bacterium]|nr:S-adenosylmethionine:tRNA ribosyltransferase-isomerase [Anaerolineae bacterium]